MDDPSYIELRTSKDHWTLIRRILKSFTWYIYMSNNSRVKIRHLNLNENEWDVAASVEKDVLKIKTYVLFLIKCSR